jgi:hypothetical protein
MVIDTHNMSISESITESWNKPIGNFYLFNDKLYALDVINGQIIKFQPSSFGFTNPVKWLTESYKLNEQSTIAIDSAVYIASNGTIAEFYKGQKTEFAPEAISPPLGNNLKISATSNYIYVLDITGKRLVVFDKKGIMINQYTSPIFDNLSGFVVSEKNKKIYFLNGSKIYGVIATHLTK